MKVWLIQVGEPLPLDSSVRKMRTSLMADEFSGKGHEVVWWASAFEHQRKKRVFSHDGEVGVEGGPIIKLLKGISYKKNISIRRYIDQKIVARKFKRFIEKTEKPDVIVASMPTYEMAYEAVVYAQKYNIPIVVDVRDLWPDTFLDQIDGRVRGAVTMLLAGDFRKLRYLLSNATAITAMSKGILNWAMGYARRTVCEYDKVFYLGYSTHCLEEVKVSDELKNTFKNIGGRKVCLFVGTHGKSYELSLIVKAAEAFYENGNDQVCFVIAGIGEQTDGLMRKSRHLTNIFWPGWLNVDEVSYCLKRSYLGLVPCRSVMDAYPNKPIEYLSVGVPLVSSIEGELSRLIEKEKIGFNYLPGDYEGLCESIRMMVADDTLRDEMSKNALSIFKKMFDANAVYGSYVDYVENIVRKVRGLCS